MTRSFNSAVGKALSLSNRHPRCHTRHKSLQLRYLCSSSSKLRRKGRLAKSKSWRITTWPLQRHKETGPPSSSRGRSPRWTSNTGRSQCGRRNCLSCETSLRLAILNTCRPSRHLRPDATATSSSLPTTLGSRVKVAGQISLFVTLAKRTGLWRLLWRNTYS